MDQTWVIVLASVLSLGGILGCVLPGLPGPPLNYAALLLVQYHYKYFSTTFMVVWGVIVVISIVIDFVLPIWTARRYGATKYGIWGSIIGMFVGLFFTPVGMIVGLLIGAVAGELWAGRSEGDALKSGVATFAGTILAIVLKLGVAALLTVYVLVAIFRSSGSTV
jgi:uncharacterized protein YqgC (DUF456 family)